MNTALEAKANAATTYSKTEVNGLLADKADANIIGEGFTTTNTVAAALNGKQGTISDLSDIRSGAALGATAVQPAALTTTLGDYATTSAMNTALADKADDSDLTALAGTVGSGTMTVNGANQATVIAAINALDTKTNGLATDQNLTDLQTNVTNLSTTVGNTALQTTSQTLTGAVNELKGDIADVLPAANTCTSSSGHCVLSIDKTTGALSWVDVTTPWVTVE